MTTVGSLCSGYGGLDLGLQLALGVPLRHAWHVEYEKHPSAILATRFPGVPNHHDVKYVDWADVEPVDWLTAGYPCQPFSLAGLRKGADDPRHLWPGVATAIRVLRPRNVLLENVAAHLRDGFDVVLADLAAMGYDARWGVVRASDAGAPHGRARLFVVATDAQGNAGRVGHRDDVRAGSRAVKRGPDAGRGAAADPDSIRRERLRSTWERWARPADQRLTAADTTGDGRREGRAEPARLIGRPDAAERGLSVAADAEGNSRGTGLVAVETIGAEGHGEPGGSDPAWGAYAPAIARWERITGRTSPRPTEPGRTERMMGQCEGEHPTKRPPEVLPDLRNGAGTQKIREASRGSNALPVSADVRPIMREQQSGGDQGRAALASEEAPRRDVQRMRVSERPARPPRGPEPSEQRPVQPADSLLIVPSQAALAAGSDGTADCTAWGAYEPAIRRWERVLGRHAPRPTEPGRTGERLSPRFVEFMMGLPDGWVTQVPGLPRNAQLKALGNGVVPQQAALALRMLNVQQAAA